MSGNFFADLHAVFEDNASRPCFIFSRGGGWTFADLEERIGQAAGVLLRSGVKPGNRVVAQVAKSAEAIALYLACLRVGAVYVPLNTAYTSAEVQYFLDDADAALFVCDPDGTDVVTAGTLTLDAVGEGSFTQTMAHTEPFTGIVARSRNDVAAIVYTSGTTGRSKGAMLTHDNLRTNAVSLRTAWGWQDRDVLLHALPIFHVHGLFIALHCALLGGTTTIFMPKFDMEEMMLWLPRSTVLMGVPTFYTRLLANTDFTRDIAKAVRVFISGSAPLTEQTFAEFEVRTGKKILERYGMSETIINTTNPLDGERVAGTVGYALPGVQVRIADETGRALAAGEVGMIEVRGQNVFAGYWQMPEKTAEEMREGGWFITGDLGTQAEDGRLSIVGRSKDLIISGGYNVYPKEVEQVIDELPEVQESAVFGVPHTDFGEAVVVAIVAKKDASAEQPPIDVARLDAALDGKLARFKQPKVVVTLEELPRNTMGKVQKNVLRDRHVDLFPWGVLMSAAANPLGDLAKDCLDVGLFTNKLDEMLEFWQTVVGLAFDHMLPVGGGVRQHRHDHDGSVFKLNHCRETLVRNETRPADTGYLRLRLARAGIAAPRELADPDGNRVQLLPPGYAGINQWAIEVACGSAEEFYRFYESGLGLPRSPDGGTDDRSQPDCAVRCGRSLIVGRVVPELSSVPLAVSQAHSSEMRALGFNYTTIQVRKVDQVHANVLANGGLEGRAPATLGETARISFVRDCRGNWMELSQRASLTGSLSA